MHSRTPDSSEQCPPAAALASVADRTRRRFLLSIGAGGAGAAMAAVAALPGAVAEQQMQVDQAGAGYRETAHVRDYYRTIRI